MSLASYRGAMALLVAALGGLSLVGNAAPQEIPYCSAAQQQRWELARDDNGVAVSADAGGLIFGRAAKKFGEGAPYNWFPMTGYRETFCGDLRRYVWYNGPGREEDIDLFLEPHAGSRSAALLQTAIDRGLVEADATEVESEITKLRLADRRRQSRSEFGYFRRPPGSKSGSNDGFYDGSPALPLRDRLVCVHGPWVTEWQTHDGKPEVHPAELTWFRDGEDTVFTQIQDASRRFQRRGKFTRYSYGGRPPKWIPWAAAPRRLAISVAFEVAAGEPVTRGLGTVPDHAFHLVAADPAGTARVSRAFDEATSLTIQEHGDPTSFAVAIGDVCRVDATPTRYRGFIEIASAVGRDIDREIGYHLFRLTADGEAPAPLPVGIAPLEPRLDLQAVHGSLSADDDGNLVGDLEYRLPEAAPDEQVASITVRAPDGSAIDVAHQRLDGAECDCPRGVLRGVPVVLGVDITVQTTARPYARALPRLGLGALTRTEAVATPPGVELLPGDAPPPGDEAWDEFARAAGELRAALPEAPASFASVERWQVTATPRYLPVDAAGQPEPDLDSPFLEALNMSAELGTLGSPEVAWDGMEAARALPDPEAANVLAVDPQTVPPDRELEVAFTDLFGTLSLASRVRLPPVHWKPRFQRDVAQIAMRVIPAMEGVELEDRFPRAFFTGLGLRASLWAGDEPAQPPSPAAQRRMTEYLNLVYFAVSSGDRILSHEIPPLRAAARAVAETS